MELSSMKICTAIPTSRALPEVVRRMPRKRISGLEALLQQRSVEFAYSAGTLRNWSRRLQLYSSSSLPIVSFFESMRLRTIGPWEMEKELIFSPWRAFLKLLILSVRAVRGGAALSPAGGCRPKLLVLTCIGVVDSVDLNCSPSLQAFPVNEPENTRQVVNNRFNECAKRATGCTELSG
ncbi:uncharacterized protein [Macaca nemestrina]|uniref:uncharacterized protein isoform X2 n=1 Tax=Macaca nemestrina TaxID=9545 RepID=UPI0039B90F43